MNTYKVYAMVDASGRITAINSNAFLPSVEGWIEIDAGMGDKYHHAQNNYLNGPLMDRQNVCRYKLQGGKVALRTQAEKTADRAAQPGQQPSEMESLMELVLDQEQRICMLEMGAE